MKKFAFLLSILAYPSLLQAKDLGIHGHCFEIEEPDLLEQITSKLHKLQSDGKLEELQKEQAEKTKHSIENPPSLGLSRTTEAREFTYNPSVTVPYDLKDHKGQAFHKAGTKVNPLDQVTLSKQLVFFDGSDPEQVEWVKNAYLEKQTLAKFILVGGKPFELMEQLKTQLFFDQQGSLTKKLKIARVPAVVTQKGKVLRIEEILVPSLPKKQTTKKDTQ